jgi:class 3 adenylate cyclase
MGVRVYLTGRIAVETPTGLADEADFPGRQGRLAFSYLALRAQRPVARDALADAVWLSAPPPAWDSALKSVISKLRTMLDAIGLSRAITSVSGCYQLRLPVDTWIDLEACTRAVDVAEAAMRRGEIERTWSEATVATAIARRPFLPGEDAPWVEDVRVATRAAHVRALDALAEVWLARGNAPLAISAAAEAVGLEPFRETGYRLLMQAHALAGNRAEAIRTYERCARVLQDELGVDPDPQTTALRDGLHAQSRSKLPHTIIIVVTDIVESTRLAASLGDRRWHEVLSNHDEITRNCVKSANGQAIKHLGDGFLLTFPTTSAAIEAVTAVQRQLAVQRAVEAPLALRAGVHAGEPVERDDDLFGLQVNIAARISALAQPGEILVSSVIHDLSPPGQITFSGFKTVDLRGVPDQVTICTAELTTRPA